MNLSKQSEVSHDVQGYSFLVCINLITPSVPLSQELRKVWPDITNFRKTTNRCARTIHHVSGISTKLTPARQLHNQHARCQKSLEVVSY